MLSNTLTEIDLHKLNRKSAKRLVIKSVKKSHSRKISCIKFITEKGNHNINSNGERGVLHKAFPSCVIGTEIEHLVQDFEPYNGYYLVYINLDYVSRSYKSLIIIIILLLFLLFVIFSLYLYYYYYIY
ncbi:hypothetical protein GLOIN_2v1765898 [Rhizophagus irregularis DAOM 181602=DAOM 197198]|uniref:Smr domain-containing protein n=1 Tax=Rhizophagus irregularis TaxID=588596 RepID=A0A2N1N5L9_9GLOM|nr:hypothetical protein RhiirC2_75599 [Rhizophagus irregularis]PKK69203.1 hypothetical protein RhiirC2_510658 [Rhizophagus irregularis]GET54011.1 hypothetical protein GLOIN_2v1765898 [Rhizophagus irregularis DAOM 181602=DAOM 197198]